MKNIKISQLGFQELNTVEMKNVVGGITQEQFVDVCNHLYNNGQYEQLSILLHRYNAGHIQFE